MINKKPVSLDISKSLGYMYNETKIISFIILTIMTAHAYITSNYLIISILYLQHYIIKGQFDFQLFAFFYFCMTMLYYTEHKLHNKLLDNPEQQYSIFLTILYALITLTYIKHIHNQQDVDYVYLGIISLVIAIIKYNKLSKQGSTKLKCKEIINVLAMTGIAGIFAKHAFIHDSYDYLLIGSLYLLYTVSEK